VTRRIIHRHGIRIIWLAGSSFVFWRFPVTLTCTELLQPPVNAVFKGQVISGALHFSRYYLTHGILTNLHSHVAAKA
jgi:hypothetical protein